MEKAGIYPEDEFEARLLHGESAVQVMLREEEPEYARRLAYLYETVDIHRARRRVEELQDLYAGRCQICLYDPVGQYGFRLCHGHHIHWLSRGGEDDLHNMLLVCPNHHSAIHREDAPFDFRDLRFTFSVAKTELVQLNRHLKVAV